MKTSLVLVVAVAVTAACKGKSGAGPESGSGSGSGSMDRNDASIPPLDDAAGSATVVVVSELEKQCAANEYESCRNLAVIVGEGVGRAADLTRAAELFSKACKGGNLAACTALGIASAQGRGVAKDVGSAVALLNQACDGAYALACRNLGLMARDGVDVKRDLGEAQRYFDRACTLGALYACTNAGELEAKLAQTAVDPATTYKSMTNHFKMGCDSKDGSACREIGTSYALGRGLPKSESAARIWFDKACKLADQTACAILAKVDGTAGSGSGSGVGSGSGSATPATP